MSQCVSLLNIHNAHESLKRSEKSYNNNTLFFLSLISISQIYLSTQTSFMCYSLGNVTLEKYKLLFCYWEIFRISFLCIFQVSDPQDLKGWPLSGFHPWLPTCRSDVTSRALQLLIKQINCIIIQF